MKHLSSETLRGTLLFPQLRTQLADCPSWTTDHRELSEEGIFFLWPLGDYCGLKLLGQWIVLLISWEMDVSWITYYVWTVIIVFVWVFISLTVKIIHADTQALWILQYFNLIIGLCNTATHTGHCSYHILHGAQVLGTLRVAIVFSQVCSWEAVLVPDTQVHPINHKNLTTLDSVVRNSEKWAFNSETVFDKERPDRVTLSL